MSARFGVICTLGTVVSAGVLYATYRIFKSGNKQEEDPKKWRAVGKLKSLYMYPLKSGHRYEIHEGDCKTSGLHKIVEDFDWGDGCFVVYNPDTMECKTAREHPVLLLINIKPSSSGKFGLSTPDVEEIEIDLPVLDFKIKKDIINKDHIVNCWDCGDVAANFVSMIILKSPSGLRLGYHNEMIKPEIKSLENDPKHTEGGCSDLTPYHLVSKTSVDKLNKELEQPVTEHYFRPNLYVYGHHIKAWEEESWKWIKIGGAIFKNIKPCVRCDICTVDPRTGEKNLDEEPLRTLEKVALLKNKKTCRGIGYPVMGVHLTLHKEGKIHVHDQVYIA